MDDLPLQLLLKTYKRSKNVKGNEEIKQVGTISANGEAEIGELLAEAMDKVGNEGVITVEEAKSDNELEVVEGMQLDVEPHLTSSQMQIRCRLTF